MRLLSSHMVGCMYLSKCGMDQNTFCVFRNIKSDGCAMCLHNERNVGKAKTSRTVLEEGYISKSLYILIF